MDDIEPYLRPLVAGNPSPKRGRKPLNGVSAMSPAEKMQKLRAPEKAKRLKHIAVLDLETDPFDNISQEEIFPFVAELYSDQFGSIVIWETNFDAFVDRVYDAIVNLPDSYTIYAHNGGKFDYMFLVSKLRGLVKFKGRAIMSAKIGNHELRDSLHILPEKLAAWKKDNFDYEKMRKKVRHKFREEILAYLHSDCLYLFDIIKSFVTEFGLKISIGQAAFSELKKSYKVSPIKESMDKALRPYFFGGRVECLAGRGLFGAIPGRPDYKCYDVNSMYPAVMANFKHPISNEYNWHRGAPNESTVFIDLSCRNFGAFMSREETGNAGFIRASEPTRHHVSIHEFKVALKYGLIEDIQIHWCIDNATLTDFAKFVLPMYNRRQAVKREMEALRVAGRDESREYEELHKQDLFLKYLLNNAYGKFAQNPRKYKDYCYTELNEQPDAEWFEFLEGADDETVHRYRFPVERCESYNGRPGFAVWDRPAPGRRYNNVGTAASITGAARAVLLEATQFADDPIYCDTDSLICRELRGLEINVSKLGAWKLEQTFDEVIIIGKKSYACKVKGLTDGHDKRVKVRSKGIPGADWQHMIRTLEDEIIPIVMKAPTINKIGTQRYLTRRLRATAPRVESVIRNRTQRAIA